MSRNTEAALTYQHCQEDLATSNFAARANQLKGFCYKRGGVKRRGFARLVISLQAGS